MGSGLLFIFAANKMDSMDSDKLPGCWLHYDFWYEGVWHRNRVRLEEDCSPTVYMMYDDHDLEITWVKRIRHKGKFIELSIVIDDDAYSPNEGRVVASAWVCVYTRRDCRHIIAQFEPDAWSYIDECDPGNNVCKDSFYVWR